MVLIAVVGTAYVDVKPDTAGFARETESKVGGIAKKAAAIFAAAFVFDKGVDLFKGFIDEANEARRVTAQVEQVIKSTGGVANVSAKDVDTLANAISRKSGIDDEAIASSEALLLTFTNVRNEVGKGNDIFAQATQAIADMSAVQGDLSSNSILVGKALQDPVLGLTALQRVGVRLTEQQKEQVKAMVEVGNVAGAQKVILQELATEFGGQAAAQATAGERLTVTIDNIREAIGTRLLPIADAFASFMADKLPVAFDFLSAKIGEFVTAVTPTVTQWANDARDLFDRLYPSIVAVGEFVRDHLQGILLGLGLLIGGLLGPITGTILVFGLLYAKFQVVRDGVQFVIDKFGELVAWVQEQVPKIKDIIEDTVTVVTFLWGQVGEFITRTFREAWELVKSIVETAVRVVTDTIEIVIDLLSGRWGQAWDAAVDVVKAVVGLIKDAIQTAFRIAVDSVLAVIEELLRLASHLPIVGKKFRGFADDIDSFRDDVNSALGGVDSKATETVANVVSAFDTMGPVMNRAGQNAAGQIIAGFDFMGPTAYRSGQGAGEQVVAGFNYMGPVAFRAGVNVGASFAGGVLAAGQGAFNFMGPVAIRMPKVIEPIVKKAGTAVGAALTDAEREEIKKGAKKLADEAAAAAKAAAELAVKRLSAVFASIRSALGLTDARQDLADALGEQAALGAEQAALPAQIAAAQAKLATAVAEARSVTPEEQVAIEDAQAALAEASKSYAEGKITTAAFKVAQNNLTNALNAGSGATDEARTAAEELADLQKRQTEIGADLTAATRRIIDATLALASSQREANDALKEWRDASPSQLQAFKDIATQAGLTKDQIDGLIKSIGTLASTGVGTIKVAPFVPPNLQTAEQLLGGAFAGGGGVNYNLAITGATLQPLDEEAIVEMQRRMGVMSPI